MDRQRTDKQRRSLDEWRAIVGRFQEADLTVAQFCAQEGVSRARLNHWRRLLSVGSGVHEQRRPRPGDFVDAGVLGVVPAAERALVGAPVTVRIELGGGVSLTVSRT